MCDEVQTAADPMERVTPRAMYVSCSETLCRNLASLPSPSNATSSDQSPACAGALLALWLAIRAEAPPANISLAATLAAAEAEGALSANHTRGEVLMPHHSESRARGGRDWAIALLSHRAEQLLRSGHEHGHGHGHGHGRMLQVRHTHEGQDGQIEATAPSQHGYKHGHGLGHDGNWHRHAHKQSNAQGSSHLPSRAVLQAACPIWQLTAPDALPHAKARVAGAGAVSRANVSGARPRSVKVGYCDTTDDNAGDCEAGEKGSLKMGDGRKIADVNACGAFCRRCARCRFISASMSHGDCSWFHVCRGFEKRSMLGIAFGGETYLTMQIAKP